MLTTPGRRTPSRRIPGRSAYRLSTARSTSATATAATIAVAVTIAAGSAIVTGTGVRASAATAARPATATATGIRANATPASNASTVLRYLARDDGYVSSARPTSRFGGNASLAAGATRRDRMITYVKFAVAPLPAGQRVTRAELRITRDGKTWPSPVKVKKVGSSAWSERTLNWKNRPRVGGELATVKPARTAGELRFDLTSSVPGAGTYTFAVTSPVSADTARFRSAERGGQGPRLVVTLAPAPRTPITPPVTAPPSPRPQACTVDTMLVPTCGLLWGAAAGGFSETPRDVAMKTWEQASGRTATIYHTYHRGDELFPTASEIAMARDPLHPRLLLLNWKVAWGTTWADVASGGQDARIDRLAAYVKTHFTEKFFLSPHHEPENDVDLAAGSGMTPRDYAAMFRHTVRRLKASGVNNAVFVMSYMNYEKWNNSPWWYDLYPGDDVVDWLAVDSYINANPGGFHNGDFAYLMDRTTDGAAFPGWYTWATTRHPGKPLMVSEWGVYDTSTTVDPANKAKLFDTVLPQLAKMPAVKGLVYFDTVSDQSGKDMRIDSTPQSLAAFRRIAADSRFNVKIR